VVERSIEIEILSVTQGEMRFIANILISFTIKTNSLSVCGLYLAITKIHQKADTANRNNRMNDGARLL
jgi:hypothetical protein